MRQTLLAISLFLCCNIIQAQSFVPTFRHYGTEEGLPSSEVYNMVQDSKGYMWFATDRGLSRFDGVSFRNYSLDDGAPELAVYRVFLDHKDRVWCVNASSTLWYIKDGEIHLYKYNHLLEETVKSGDDAINIVVDSADGVHLGYYKSGYHHITKDGQYFTTQVGDKKPAGAYFKKVGNHGLVFRIRDKNAHDPSVYYLDKQDTVLYRNFGENLASAKLRPCMGLSTSHGMMTYGNLILLLNKDSISSYDTHQMPLSVCEADGKTWVGTYNGGVTGFKVGTLEPDISFLPGQSVTAVYRDHEGGYWFSTLNSGVFYTPSLELRTLSGDANLKHNRVTAIITSKDSSIFIAQLDGTFLRYRNKNWHKVKPVVDSVASIITAFTDPQTDSIILSGSTRSYTSDGSFIYPKPMALATHKVAILPNSKTLLAIGSDAIYEYDQMQIVNGIKMNKRGLTIHYGVDSVIHLGTFSGYAILENDSVIDYSHKHELLSVRINTITSNRSKLFLGTMGEGVVITQGDSVWQITTKDGMNSDFVNRLIIDNNRLIAATSLGVSIIEFNGNSFTIENIDQEDGLISNEATCLLSHNDSLWIGTRKGLSLMPRRGFARARVNPIVNLVELRVNNREILPSLKLELDHDENEIEIVFNGISYKQNGIVDFRYKLEGADGDWVNTTNTKVRFTGLAAGDYTFHLQMNLEGTWVKALDPMNFIIDAPLWQKWWVLLIINLSVAATLIFFYIRRLRTVRQRNAIQEQLKDFHLQALAAQMNPHFLFNSLNAIQDVLLHKSKIEASSYLARFARLMRTILNNSSKSEIPLSDELDALQLYLDLEMLRFDHRFTYSIEVADDVKAHELQVPNLLIQPFVENAIWHGLKHRSEPGGHVSINIICRASDLICTIEDNGVGRAYHKSHSGHDSQGSSITDKRLNLILGNRNNLIIKDLKNERNEACGTLVEIRLPHVRK